MMYLKNLVDLVGITYLSIIETHSDLLKQKREFTLKISYFS